MENNSKVIATKSESDLIVCVLLNLLPLLKQVITVLYNFRVRNSVRAQWEQSEKRKTLLEIKNIISEILKEKLTQGLKENKE